MTKQLKVEKKTYLKISYRDFDSFVESVYGRPFSVTGSEEMSNDSIYSFNGIDGVIKDYDEEDLKLFLADEKDSYMARLLLNDLVRKKLIEPGDYVISVSW